MSGIESWESRWGSLLRGATIAGCVLLSLAAQAWAAGGRPSGGEQIAADEPRLPAAPPPIGKLRHGADGKIEVVDPKKEKGSGARRCAEDAICVGPDQAYPSLTQALAAAHEGDVIEVVGATYRESVRIGLARVTVRGVAGRPHFDCAGLRLVGDKACLLLAANGITLENLEISGAELPESAGANGACIRNEAKLSFTVRQVLCHGSQNGILSGGGDIVIENSEFFDNGWTGQTHNVYFSGDCTVTVRGSTFRDARIGHEFKSRCRKTTITDSMFRSTKGSRDIDIPDGGETLIYRSTLVKTVGTDNSEIIGFTPESCANPGDMTVKDVRIVNSEPNADIRNFDKCAGHAIILQGITVEGVKPKEFGYILHR